MRAHYCYEARKFINRPGYLGAAYIFARVYPDGSGTVSIADCSDEITLEFRAYDRGWRANSLHKVDLLLKTLTEFRAALVAAHEEANR